MNLSKHAAAALSAGLCLCLLAGCGSAPASSAASSPQQAAASSAAAPAETPDAAEGYVQAAQPLGLFSLYSRQTNYDIITDGTQVLAAGNAQLITDMDTGEALGYWLDTPTDAGHCYDVYDARGGLLAGGLTCCPQYFLNGRLVCFDYDDYSSDDEIAGCRLIDPATGENLLPANKCGYVNRVCEGQYLVSGYYGSSPNESSFIINGEGKVVHMFEGCSAAYTVVDYNQEAPNPVYDAQYITVNRQNGEAEGLYDVATGRLRAYGTAYFANDGYYGLEKLDGNAYDWFDAQGNAVETDTPLRYTVYAPGLKVWYDCSTEMYGMETPDATLTTPDYITAGLLGSGFYTVTNSMTDNSITNTLTLYAANGSVVYTCTAEPDVTLTCSCEDSLLMVSAGCTVMLLDESGLLWQKQALTCSPDDGWVNLNTMSTAEGEPVRLNLYTTEVIANSYHTVYTLMDLQGNTLATGFSELYGTTVPGIYRARRGFTCGLVNSEGQWVYSRSVYADSPEDESPDLYA